MLPATLMILALLAVLVAAVLYGSRFLMKRAVRAVVREFRDRGATTPRGAVAPQQLGLVPNIPFGQISTLRNYRPQALRLLMQTNVVKATDEGRLYLSEDALQDSPVGRYLTVD